MSVLTELRVFFLSDPAKIGAQPVPVDEIVATVRSKVSLTSQPSPLARMAAELLADSEPRSAPEKTLPSPIKYGDA